MTAAPDAFGDAIVAARLCAIDPAGLGGLLLRGDGEARDEVIAAFREALPATAPWRRIPASVDAEQLLGGLDLGATLARGELVRSAGLLASADRGAVIVPMAERMPEGMAASIASLLDTGTPARIAVVLLDDGIASDERPPEGLAERLAFHLDLTGTRPTGSATPPAPDEGSALSFDEVLAALIGTAAALGIGSARAPLFALRAARAAATLAGRSTLDRADVILAARLVLAPRATQAPPADAPAPADDPALNEDGDSGETERRDVDPLAEIVLAATRAALPQDVLARIAEGGGRRQATSRSRGAGERRRSMQRGRPLGARSGKPHGGARLSLIDTLRAAAPWQRLRRVVGDDPRRVRIRRDDLRIRRFEIRAEATTIFAVDASGSSALARLAEAKGAVELLLADAYVKRAQVALIAFRGTTAELLLPATRSLARARRALAELPGGGGTPLAAGLDAARHAAEAARARGRTPFIVMLTDGRANVASDGSTVRAAAERDALAAARAIRAAGFAAAFIDISARPRADGAALAADMGARYLALPRADAAAMHAAVKAAQPRTAGR